MLRSLRIWSDFSTLRSNLKPPAQSGQRVIQWRATPLDVEASAADPVEAGERSVELFAEVLREAGSVALNEAIFGAVPLSRISTGWLNCVCG